MAMQTHGGAAWAARSGSNKNMNLVLCAVDIVAERLPSGIEDHVRMKTVCWRLDVWMSQR